MDDLLHVTVWRRDPNCCDVTVSGQLDAYNTSNLRDVLKHAIRACGKINLILSHLTFRDLASLHALLVGVRLAESHHADLHLHRVPHFLVRLLRQSYKGAITTESVAGD
ncbi:STAS domain-containing protein [Streptomyces sp. NPDC051577]|uniref:STAS domain-containing protein n=1 Tax=Streptomyces sp. NPDC051577 TaxID=3155166 RepID=UPI003412CBB8